MREETREITFGLLIFTIGTIPVIIIERDINITGAKILEKHQLVVIEKCDRLG